MNVVVLLGHLTNDPLERTLPSGDTVTSLEITTGSEPGDRWTVPVAVPGELEVGTLATGDEVLVTGVVRRRFFRVGGVTQSRTEVVAHTVVPAGQRRRVRAVLRRSAERLGAEPQAAVRSGADGGHRRPPR